MIRLAATLLIAVIAEAGISDVTAYFSGDRITVAERIAVECVADRLDVDRKDDREVVCGKPITGIKGAWLKFGRDHGTLDEPSRQRTIFLIRAAGSGLQVQARRVVGHDNKPIPWDARSADAVFALLKRARGTTEPSSLNTKPDEEFRTTGPIIIDKRPEKL